jgi:multiple sugar transport system permease protein
MLYPAVILLLVSTIFPSIYTLVLSFNEMSTSRRAPGWQFQGLGNYLHVFSDPRALNSLFTTGLFVTTVVPAEIAFGIAIAVLFTPQRQGAGISRAIIMLPMMTTPVVIGLIWRLMFNTDVGLINFVFRSLGLPALDWLGSASTGLLSVGIAEVWEWTPFVALIVLAALQAMPIEPVQAATVDGASGWQIFRFITLPYLWPTIAVCLLLRSIDVLKSFDLFYVLTGGGPGTSSEVIGLFTYRQGFNFFKLGYASALSYVILFIVVIIANILVFSGLFRQTR